MTIEEKNKLIEKYTKKINQLTMVINKMELQSINPIKINKVIAKRTLYENMRTQTQSL
ncbi:MAG: hypothetical protein ACOCVF_02535 [bacterium]